MRAALLVLVVAACGQEPTTLRIESASPEYAPVIGGTTIRIIGTGFVSDEGGPNRVLIASREAPLSRTIDDTTLEVVLPPGEGPGDAEVVVLNRHGNARATGILRYSAPPTIEALSPADVVFSSGATVVTLTGRGLLDEGAGEVSVIVDGQLGTDVVVTSDTSLTFVAPVGTALVRPDIELVNSRGSASKQRGFRYTPSERPGLLLFSASGAEFAIFYDPADQSTISIPLAAAPSRFTAVVRDDRGDYWGAERSRRFGPIDMRTQRLASQSPLQAWLPAMDRVGAEYFAINRSTLRFGKLEPVSGSFTQIGTLAIQCCGSYGLAFDGTTLYYTARQAGTATIRSIDPTTGIAGTPVSIVTPPGFHVEDMRFFQGTLYVSTYEGLVTLDPLTGSVTGPVVPGRFNAIEVFD
jgi:streptogramin lyase